MTKVVVVADDLTGANATGVLLGKNGLSTSTLLDQDNIGSLDSDCLICPTDSRNLDGVSAYNRVYDAINLLKSPGIRFYSKRVDSTLRGNIGAETDAILDALGDGWIAIAVVCFPQAKRITVGGRLLVDSVPLHLTEVAADPKNQIDTPVVEDIFRRQTKCDTRAIYIEDVFKGPAHLAKLVEEAAREGIRILIFDAISPEDLDVIAQGVAQSDIRFVAVDPGAFTAACAKAIVKGTGTKTTSQKKILSVVGSVNGVALAQVLKFLDTIKCHNVFIDIDRIVGSIGERGAEIRRVRDEINARAREFDVLSIVGSGIHPQNRIDFIKHAESSGMPVGEISATINDSIAQITAGILADNPDIAALYTCGGDISVAVCRHLGVYALELHSEVVPLASFGELKGGQFEGLKFITKGGMVGDEDALITCIEYLCKKV